MLCLPTRPHAENYHQALITGKAYSKLDAKRASPTPTLRENRLSEKAGQLSGRPVRGQQLYLGYRPRHGADADLMLFDLYTSTTAIYYISLIAPRGRV